MNAVLGGMKYRKRLLLCMIALLCGIFMAKAQTFGSVLTLNRNHTVSVSARFHDADDVYLIGSLAVEIKRSNIFTMLKINKVLGKDNKVSLDDEDDSVWTYTSKPLPSDFYTYAFDVDGVDTLDKSNANQVRDVDTWYNWFIIPGGVGDYYADRSNVDHGKVEAVWYPSRLSGLPRRRMMVYTPPRYDRARRYPVLYLLHGSGGDEKSWLTLGRVAQIMDNMIAEHKCQPMIVVMPNEIADRAATPGEDPYNNTPAKGMAIESMFGTVETAFLPEVVNYIDRHYSTLADKAHRAIAGLSLGGMHALYISANNPQSFDYVGLFSAQVDNKFASPDHLRKIRQTGNQVSVLGDLIPALSRKGLGRQAVQIKQYVDSGHVEIYDSLDAKLQQQFAVAPKLYYIAIGSSDFLLKDNNALCAKLAAAHYPYVYNPSEGGHEWSNWRKYLLDFLPRLFKE